MKMTTPDYKSIASKLDFEGRAFIDGKYVDAVDGQRFENINPATGETLCYVAKCNYKDADLAVKASRKAFESGIWSRKSPEFRKDVLINFANLLRQYGEENSVLECVDTGKLIGDCIDEVANDAPMHFQWYGELIDKVFGKIAPTDPSITSLIVKEPIGVVAGIVPWNFPLMMAVWKAAPALATGCSVIIKPAEDTPLTAIRVAQIAKEAGIPDGVFNVVPGFGDVGEALGRHNDVDAVSFTGSTEVGGYFMKYSGESNLKTVGLEMGGKSPFIVLGDAKITDDLIDNAMSSAFWNGGQNCSANMRQIIHSKVKEEFLDKVIKKIKTIKVGDPLDPESNMGSMISKKHLATVDGFIQKGIDEGASLLYGGVSGDDKKGFFAKPTLFDNLTENMTIAQDEIFGPVLGVLTVNSTEEALMIANNSRYGLHASVFTQDINEAFHMAKSLPCGTVSVNTFSEGDIKTPFGGYKQSGSLSRDQGTEALNQYLQTKTIWISHL
jgi:acyl-CoA reductase-like NAD-dependent aldehyde dehydrogenase